MESNRPPTPSATVRIVRVTDALIAEFPMLAVDRPDWAAVKFVGDTPTQIFQGLTCRGDDGSLIYFQSRVRRVCGSRIAFGGVVTDPPVQDTRGDYAREVDYWRLCAGVAA